jgi:DNA-binding CsgD family transcriptional regulator
VFGGATHGMIFPAIPPGGCEVSVVDAALRSAAVQALEQAGVTALDLDATLRISAMTRSARAWLERSSLWRLKGNRLVCKRSTTEARLEAHVARATEGADGTDALQWSEHSTPMVGVVKSATYVAERPMARLYVLGARADDDNESCLPLWRSVWLLTDQECRVADLLARGHDGSAITRSLGITANTLKFHVRGLLTKTATKSRSEMVARLATLRIPLQ